MRVYLSTLGCKLNESELESWARGFAKDGHEIVTDPREADLCVVNTCAITHVAARKSRQVARQLARVNPNARIVLTGCYASTSPDDAARLPNIALVVPNADKDRLVQMVHSIMPIADCTISAISHQPSAISHSRTRAFVKIEDGCNMSCSYCIIPLARGKERSRPLREIVSEIQSLVGAGYKEIILTGVQISVYRDGGANCQSFDSAQDRFVLRDLVSAILAETNVPRLRLTSIAPWDLDESLLDLWQDPRLCRHLHLSLQSGSDSVLRRMRRPYTTAQFARAANLARERIPNVAITTDVIVGFPGESDDEFEASLHFVETMQFSRVHVFPYSARAGTIAANLPLHVPEKVKAARMKQMQALADMSARAFAQKFVGRTMDVLWENTERGSNGAEERGRISHLHPRTSAPMPIWSGYTDNYVRVFAASAENLANQIAPVRLTDVALDGATGVMAYFFVEKTTRKSMTIVSDLV